MPSLTESDHEPQSMLQAPSLGSLPGIRHAFFTRQGGVSDGIYASLNGGVGSRRRRPPALPRTAPAWRPRSASRPDHLLTAYQIHSPDVVTAERPWDPSARPQADAIVTKVPGLAIGVGTADCGPILFADAAAGVDRRGPCRLARRVDRRGRGDDRRHGALRRRPRPHRGRARPDDPPGQLRGRGGIRRAFQGCRRGQRAFLPARRASGPRAVRSRRLYRGAAHAAPACDASRISATAPMQTPICSSAIGARCIAPNQTTAATSTRLRS